jgi:hypothetical protein
MEQEEDQVTDSSRNPDEISGLLVDSKILIFDPESDEVLVETRA